MRTRGVKRLVEQALASLPKPFDEDIIEHVFVAIEHRPEWFREYEGLCDDLTKTVVNNWIGVWVSRHVGRSGAQQVVSANSSLAGSYSKLTSPFSKPHRKLKEAEARTLMSEYYFANRAELPADIRNYRESIVDLLMDGASAEEAFAAVKQRRT